MNIDFKKENGTCVLSVSDEQIDIQNANEFRDILLEKINNGHNKLLVDLSLVTFIDSSGLSALIYALREARKKNGTIKLSKLSEHVSSVFSITRLDKIFELA